MVYYKMSTWCYRSWTPKCRIGDEIVSWESKWPSKYIL
jgi:hypothetical protein